MADFDWVTALFSCSPDKVFEVLKLQVERDVKIRNGLLQQYSPYAFEFVPYGDRFTALIKGDRRSVVSFCLTDKGISVLDNEGKPMFEAVLTLNDKGECIPKINGKEYQFWQMRKMALEDLFRLGSK